ncbi:MAG TPA: hypothetical protein VEU33_16740 [Archangium sp.]|nr:hypothetical protein [Archangium sp.]
MFVWGALLCALPVACVSPGATQQGMTSHGRSMRPPAGGLFPNHGYRQPTPPMHQPSGTTSDGSSGGSRTAPSTYGLDTTKTCKDPATCAAVAGKDFETVRQVGTAVASTAALTKLFEEQQPSIEKKLEECANRARADVLARHRGQFKKEMPDAEECRQTTKADTGRKMTWAQRLGEEMHKAARDCADLELGALRKGRYSLEQRYRIINTKTGEKKLVSTAEEEALKNTGNGAEWKGTVKPDVVIHEGDPLNAQAVYDFKFPCGEKGRPPDWSQYPERHPFAGQFQKAIYKKYIAPFVARIVPWLGVLE